VYSRIAQDRVGDLTASVERAISAVRTVRAANAVQREIDTVDTDSLGAWRAGLDVARISAFVVPISSIAMQVSFLVVLGVGGFRVASGTIEVAQLVSFILFLFIMIMPLGQAIGAFTSVMQALGALGRIQEIIELPGETEGDVVTERLDGELRRSGLASFGVCSTCRYFRERGRSDDPKGPHLCMLFEEPLTEDDAGRICREHHLAG
jgi:ATP-binding cassette subfamily B protein